MATMTSTKKTPTPIPLMSLAKQHKALSRELKRAVGEVLDSGVFIMGPQVRAFEQEFAQALGLPRVLGVDSGTSALELALKACGVGPGDEVIVPTFTFIATATAVSFTGATPVMADVDWRTMTLTAEEVRKKLTPKTKAVVPVHLFGQPADMDPLIGLAKERGLRLVEDCAQSHLAKYKGRPAGALGDVSCFSFYPSKNMGAAGDAGALAVGNKSLEVPLEELRNCGREIGQAYRHARVGYNCRLDEIQAAILRVKLRHLAQWTEKRRALAAAYNDKLSRLPLTLPPHDEHGTTPVFHLYVVRTPRRDELMAHLKAQGIGCGVYYPIPVHRQPAYRGLLSSTSDSDFPNAERASREALALPLYPELTAAEAARVVKAVRGFFTA
jgi:dTDP-4-amino-4,6-dideoxygalactose transaminase